MITCRQPMLLARHHPSELAQILSIHAQSRFCSHNKIDHSRQKRFQSQCQRCIGAPQFAVSTKQIPPRPTRNSGGYEVLRHHFSDSSNQYKDDDTTSTSTRRRPVSLKSGRAHRKWKLKQREESLSREEKVPSPPTNNEDGDGTSKEKNPDDAPKFEGLLSGGNPIRERYLMNQRIKYPKTISGWKKVWKKAWAKYLWTFEGFLIREKKRDADGNIIPEDEYEDDKEFDWNEKEEEGPSLKDKATEAATGIAQNVQKNISTLKEETPKLIQLGQQVTGVTTKEELKVWVGEQLKLATACLSEFMKGYRKGRDEEIDRMLNEYFKDVDEKNESAEDEEEVKESLDDDNATEDDTSKRVKREKRTWGRRERRRLKASGIKEETDEGR